MKKTPEQIRSEANKITRIPVGIKFFEIGYNQAITDMQQTVDLESIRSEFYGDCTDCSNGFITLSRSPERVFNFFLPHLQPAPVSDAVDPISINDRLPEDTENVLWFKLPVIEPPYCGSLYDTDFTHDYYTHWVPIPKLTHTNKIKQGIFKPKTEITMELKRETVKANKDHKCDFCCQTILKGHHYENSSQVQDGRVYTWKNHTHCTIIALTLKMYEHCDEGLSAEDFQESICVEYDDLMKATGVYETREFKYPPFKDRLNYILTHHKII